MRGGAASDGGFTLIEVLVSLVITGMIALAVGGAFVLFMSTNERSLDQQAIARDQFWLSSWFLADAQSATEFAADEEVAVSCDGVPGYEPDTSRNVVQLRWADETSETPTEYEVNYRAQRASTDEPWRLDRFFCEGGTEAERVTVVQALADTLTFPPSIEEESARLTIRLTSAIDDVTQLEATGGRHVTP
jgi:prepilin-type N-terminal cleavage/methylation domain-containing protein